MDTLAFLALSNVAVEYGEVGGAAADSDAIPVHYSADGVLTQHKLARVARAQRGACAPRTELEEGKCLQVFPD